MGAGVTGTAESERRSGHESVREAAAPSGNAPIRTLAVLFIMRSLNGYLRFFRGPLELLVERGHDVRLLLERGGHGEVEERWLDSMLEHPNFSVDICDHFGPKERRGPHAAVRCGIEYVRVLASDTDRSTIHFRHRLRDAPPSVLRLDRGASAPDALGAQGLPRAPLGHRPRPLGARQRGPVHRGAPAGRRRALRPRQRRLAPLGVCEGGERARDSGCDVRGDVGQPLEPAAPARAA